jgi:riboflavin kinase / FMN adenylyltransferase
MIIYNKPNRSKNKKNTIVAVGNFDGLHLGHKKVLLQAKKKAKKHNLDFGVVTFEPVPVMFFNKNITNHRINNFNQKIEGLRKLKVNFINVIKFNKKFSNLNPDEFIKKILVNKLKVRFIFISKNFKFGKNREGNINTLKQKENFYSYESIITTPLKKKNKILSSSIIRHEISKGNISKVNKYLGRPWGIEGTVVKGKKRGRKIGFPTCNINIKDYILPRLGVYAVNVKLGKKHKKGIANIGYRPTFKGKKILLEVNIFGLKQNLYKKTLKVSFVKFIRKEKKFKNINELKIQIKKDIKLAKK